MKLHSRLALILTIANFSILPAFAQLPTTPDAPPPPGNPVPGGTYSDSPECLETTKPVNALIPRKNLEPLLIGQGLTTSEYLTIWVYSPYSSADISSGQFSLHNRRGRRLYRTSFNLPKTPGIISIQIPNEPEYALENDRFYRWYFSLKCTPNPDSPADLVIDGWVKKVAVTPESEAQINTAQQGIWYDSLNRLANLRLANPEDERLKQDWSNLLTSAGLEALVEEPLLGPVIESTSGSIPLFSPQYKYSSK